MGGKMLRICILSAAARLQVAGYVIVKTIYVHTHVIKRF